jgi:hypothetical protein
VKRLRLNVALISELDRVNAAMPPIEREEPADSGSAGSLRVNSTGIRPRRPTYVNGGAP